MFTLFNINKLRYEKGQLAPFFIAVTVILIIMAFVTINLAKVALIRTDSCNAVDAGALAAGAVMANIFNSLAQGNSTLESYYYEFLATVSVDFAITLGAEAFVLSAGCMTNTSSWAKTAFWNLLSIIIAFAAFHAAQYYTYISYREMGDKGYEAAKKVGHQLAFGNSGIGSKLQTDDYDASAMHTYETSTNYQDQFTDWVDAIGDIATDDGATVPEEYTYSWTDRQNRGHYVWMKIDIDPIEKYDLQVLLYPIEIELGLLIAAIDFQGTAWGASPNSYPCCAGKNCKGCPGCAVLVPAESWALGLTAGAFTGVSIGAVVEDTGGLEIAVTMTIAWIDEIKHDHLVDVYTTQHHEGKSYSGIWDFHYPVTPDAAQGKAEKITSWCEANFENYGKIYPPNLNFDVSIVETD